MSEISEKQDIAKLIDHTLLKSDASEDELKKLCEEAKEFGFNSICIRPEWIKQFSPYYRCSAVIDFPEEPIFCSSAEELKAAKTKLGQEDFDIKSLELKKALEDGALELDPVMNISKLKIEDMNSQEEFKEELVGLINVTRDYEKENPNPEGIWIKPIFSCECLNEDELEMSLSIMVEAVLEFKDENTDSKIHFAYKNSTGFVKATEGSELEIELASPRLIKSICEQLDFFEPEKLIKVKAAGGIKSKEHLARVLEASKKRISHIGTSSSKSIL